MNRLPCPKCGKSLLWGGVGQKSSSPQDVHATEGKGDVDGKHWYQYIHPPRYCKSCGTRIRFSLETQAFWAFVFWLLVLPLIAIPLSPKFGWIALAVVALLGIAAFKQLGRYDMLQSSASNAEPPSTEQIGLD